MNNTNLAFNGFTSGAAKKSLIISRVLSRLINSVESDIKVITSTPKSKGSSMELSFSKYYDNAAKDEQNFHITMDYDSGYISHTHESNSDSSLENLTEPVVNPSSSKPIYLSEDALLEKPEVNVKFLNLSVEIERENFEETRNIFNTPESVIPTSVVSQETSYSGFDNDSDSEKSIEIHNISQIIVENLDSPVGDSSILNVTDLQSNNVDDDRCNNVDDDFDRKTLVENLDSPVGDNSILNVSTDLQSNNIDYSSSGKTTSGNETVNCVQQFDINRIDELSSDEHSKMGEILPIQNNERSENVALDNITNTCSNSKVTEKKKKLTLIFSKDNKENVYSVKRKFSISPDKSLTPDKPELLAEKTVTPESTNQENISLKEQDVSMDLGKHLEKIICAERGETSGNSFLVISPRKHVNVINECDQSKTPEKKYVNPVDPNISPDLFVDEDPVQETINEALQPLTCIAEERFIIKKDHRIIKRVQNGLKGVLPPLSVTVVQLSVNEMLNRLETNKDYWWTNTCPMDKIDTEANESSLNVSTESEVSGEPKSLLITGALDNCINKEFPDILKERYHGLHYNRSKLSEEFEELCTRYAQRYIGAETQSTCTVFEPNFVSPTKRKIKQRWAVKSPGRRLSHLARRRITFSSANLQAGASSVAGSRARQILVDAKKLDLLNRRRSPRKSPRKTPKKPSKSPRITSRTPSSSAKKKLALRFRELTGEIEKTVPSTSSENTVLASKRALFQSPDHDKKSSLFLPSTSGLSVFDNEFKNLNTKRNLFLSPSKRSPRKNSPFKRSPFKRLDLGAEKKRKRSESDDTHPSKFARSMSLDIRPSESEISAKFSRTKSDMNISLNRSQGAQSGELSAIHKKKLQWAVYEALRSQNITPCHLQFKLFASILARVTRRFLPSLTGNAPRPEGGTSERMLRIARHHVYAVIKGKSVDEIISEYTRNRLKTAKPQGYVGIDEFYAEKKNDSGTSNKENILQGRVNAISSLEKKKLELLGMPKGENKVDRIRKVIDFDNR